MRKKIIDRLLLLCIMALFAAFTIIGLTSCKDTEKEQGQSADPTMELLRQTNFFKSAPEELYFGKALQESFSDQGVTIKHRAAFHDGEATYIFFDVIDTGAGIFSQGSNGLDFSLDQYDFLEKAGYNDSRLHELISYEEETRTATICVEYIGPLQIEELSFHIYSMTGNQKMINKDFEKVDLYEMLKDKPGEYEPENEYIGGSTSFGVIDEQTGESRTIEMPEFDEGNGTTTYRLKKDVLSIPVEDEEGNHVADITNIGWKNGWLHIQLNPENRFKWETNFNLENNRTEDLVYSPFHLSFGTGPDGEALTDYYEYVFYVGAMTEENLDCSIVFKNSAYRAVTLKGDWEIKLSIPDSLLKRLEADKRVPVDDQQLLIRRAVISPVNITLFASGKDVPEDLAGWFWGISVDDLKLKILYQDGKTAAIPEGSGYIHGNQKGAMFRLKHTAENFEEITGLEVNGVYFPVVTNQ